jgi:spore germination protein GerM
MSGGSQPPPPLNLSGGELPQPTLNLSDGCGFLPPALNMLRISEKYTGSSKNYQAFRDAQRLAEEEGTALNHNFTTSPSLNFEQKEEWETERKKSEIEAQNIKDVDTKSNKRIKFVEEKPITYYYTPEYSSSDILPEGGGNVTKNN